MKITFEAARKILQTEIHNRSDLNDATNIAWTLYFCDMTFCKKKRDFPNIQIKYHIRENFAFTIVLIALW